jgi:hypothetical protein
VRISAEELHETATRLNLQKTYDLDVDLVQSVVCAMASLGGLEAYWDIDEVCF